MICNKCQQDIDDSYVSIGVVDCPRCGYLNWKKGSNDLNQREFTKLWEVHEQFVIMKVADYLKRFMDYSDMETFRIPLGKWGQLQRGILES